MKQPLDVEYLASLSGEAIDPVMGAVLSAMRANASPASDAGATCAATRRLLTRWGPKSRAATRREAAGAWRTWNAGEAHALEVVGAQAAALDDFNRAHCPSPPAASRGAPSDQR